MQGVTQKNFGLLIAYLLPGFTALWGLSALSPMVSGWIQANAAITHAVTVGGFMYATLASIALGMTVSAIRWALIDTVHGLTGLRRPAWSDASLQNKLAALESLIEHHYRYYQFHSNMVIALLVVYAAHLEAGKLSLHPGRIEATGLAICSIFWMTGRDNLKKYYRSVTTLLEEVPMSNGRHHAPAAKTNTKEKQPDKSAKPKDQAAVKTAAKK
jgi:hypothetical protein